MGSLPELARVLRVTVDEILDGKEAVREYVSYEGNLLDILAERAWEKASGLRVKPCDFAGALCFLLSAGLTAVQIWHLFIGRERGLVYLTDYIPAVMTGAAVALLWIGGVCIRRLRRIWKKGCVMVAAAVLFITGIAVCMVFRPAGKEIISLSPDASNIMKLQIEENEVGS